MGQFGFFDADRRLAAISAKGDPLEMIARVVPFESFRAEIEAAVLTLAREKKSAAGRKPIDVLVMFRMLVLQSLYNLSDEQVEYQVRDRLSFTRFLGLGIEDGIPDGTTLWLFRETLAKAGLIEKLFERFGQHLEAKVVGRVEDLHELLLALTQTRLQNVKDIGRTILRSNPNGTVLLSDVAEISEAPQPNYTIVTADGRPAVLLNVLQQSDGNTVQIVRDVAAALDSYRQRLPAGVTI